MEKEKIKKDDELRACQEQVAHWKDKCTHLQADLENFKRRIEKEKEGWLQVAQTDFLLKLLPVVDDFDRALSEERAPEMAAQLKGFELIASSLHKFLAQAGVTEITQVSNFDPELHEAVARVASDDHESNQIVEVLQKGFMLKDRILRPAKVTVSE